MSTTKKDPIDKIMSVTTLTAIAKRCGVSVAAVSGWRHKRVPLHHCRAVFEETGIPPAELRPEVAQLMSLR